MRTYLVITRGDALDPVPVAICDDPELVDLAIRSAWRRMQDMLRTSRPTDPLGAELAANRIRHLQAIAQDLGHSLEP